MGARYRRELAVSEETGDPDPHPPVLPHQHPSL